MPKKNDVTHIVHLIETLGAGGAERLLHTNLTHLDRERFRSTVVTVFSHGDRWTESIRQLGISVLCLDCSGPTDLVGATWRLVKILRLQKADLVHTHLLWANLIGRIAARINGLPVVSSIHAPDYEPEVWCEDPGVSLGKLAVIRYLDRWTARIGCSRIIAVSKYVQKSTHHRLKFPLERIELLYNPVDLNEVDRLPGKHRAELLHEFGLPPESKLLVQIGRVVPQKGLVYSVRALPEILKQHPQVHLIVAGTMNNSNYINKLRNEAKSLRVEDCFHLVGPRTDVPDLLRASDLFLFPSVYEGQGIALMEAMSVGCACIASDTGPLPEVVTHGKDGWLVAARNSGALAEATSMLLTDSNLREALGQQATKTVRARFRPETAVEDLAAVYMSILQGARTIK